MAIAIANNNVVVIAWMLMAGVPLVAGCGVVKTDYVAVSREDSGRLDVTVRVRVDPTNRSVIWWERAVLDHGQPSSRLTTLSGCTIFDESNWECGDIHSALREGIDSVIGRGGTVDSLRAYFTMELSRGVIPVEYILGSWREMRDGVLSEKAGTFFRRFGRRYRF